MKRKNSKVMFLLAALLVMVYSTTVFAANVSLPPEEADLVIHKYIMDNVSGAVIEGDGTPLNPSDLPTGAEPLDGITFNLYKITIGADGIYPAPGVYTLDDYDNPTSFTDVNGKSFAVTPASTASVTTAGGGVATAAALPQGIYLIVEQASPLVSSPVSPFAVAVPMTNPDGDGWLDEVHVYPKNEDMSIEKEVNIDAVTIGDIVTYTITPSVPSDIASSLKFDVIDILDSALDYQSTPGVVVRGALTKAGLDNNGGTVVPDTNYTVTHSGGVLTVSFNSAGRTHLGTEGYKFISITFDTKVNAGILDKTSHVIGNEATVEFTNQFDQDTDRDVDHQTDIHTGSVAITKVDGTNNSQLSGAKFQIASSEANALAGNYLKIDAAGNIIDFGEAGYAAAGVWELTTDTNGEAVFEGIKDYIDNAGTIEYCSYWIVETEAPAGYNLLNTPVEVTFTAGADESNDFTVDITVENNKGFSLPKTGGMGTLLFTIGGIVFIGIAVILMIASGKKKKAVK